MALSWYKNVERLSKLCGHEIPQTVKGASCPTLLYSRNELFLRSLERYFGVYFHQNSPLVSAETVPLFRDDESNGLVI